MDNRQGRGILYFIVIFAGILSLHYTTSHFKSDRQIILLNTTRPDFNKLLDLEEEHASHFAKGPLKEYFDYYRLVTGAMPGNSDGLLMLGYLYEITGDKKQALVFLNKAHQLDPAFFFTEYNLGLLAFEQGDYSQSTGILQNALAIGPQQTLDRMMHSIVYRQFLSSMNDSQEIIAGLKQAYQDADALLTESMAKQKGPQEDNAPAFEVHAHIM